MRRLVVFGTLLALTAPFVATAGRRTAGDGTLSVRDLNGYFAVQAKGGIVGRCDRCVLFIDELRDDDPIDPVVTNARGRDTDGDGDPERYPIREGGRWKVIGGSFSVVVTRGIDIDVSLVGRGRVRLRGTTGTYSLNGADPLPVPTDLTQMTLRAPSP